MKNNKGFSLVELIIVIAMLAILSGVLVVYIAKYVNRAAVETDKTTCVSIEKMMYTILMDDENHDLYALNGGVTSGRIGFVVIPERNTQCLFTKSIELYADKLHESIVETITANLDPPEESGMHSYLITVQVKEDVIKDERTGDVQRVYSVGDIEAHTSTIYSNDELKEYFRGWGANRFDF